MIAHDTAVTGSSGADTQSKTQNVELEFDEGFAPGTQALAVFDIDSHGKIRSWNRDAEQFTGYRGAEKLGTKFGPILGDREAAAKVRSFFDRTMSGERLELESTITNKNGEEFPASITLTRLFDADGRPSGFSALLKRLPGEGTTEERLLEREAQLRSLASHLQRAREEENSYIAKQLHDEFSQMLTALRIDLSILGRMISRTVSESLGRGSLLEKISSVSDVVEKAIKLASDMITELRPAVLDELGLLSAIQWKAVEFGNRTGIACHVTRLPRGETFGQTVTVATFRILQEALDNVMRHSEATEVYIGLDVVNSTILLEVNDNGKGIEADKLNAPTSIGLIGMRERVRALGGTLTLYGEQGKGTTLTVVIPFSDRGLPRVPR